MLLPALHTRRACDVCVSVGAGCVQQMGTQACVKARTAHRSEAMTAVALSTSNTRCAAWVCGGSGSDARAQRGLVALRARVGCATRGVSRHGCARRRAQRPQRSTAPRTQQCVRQHALREGAARRRAANRQRRMAGGVTSRVPWERACSFSRRKARHLRAPSASFTHGQKLATQNASSALRPAD
jgi:hypothetical protein